MKNMGKRLFGVFLSVCIVLTLLPSMAFAADNNYAAAQSGTVIALNGSASGELSACDEVDWFKFTIAEEGTFQVKFTISGGEGDIKDGWDMTIYKDGVFDDSLVRDLSPIKENTNSSVFNVGKGTYYVRVKAVIANSSWAPVGRGYTLSVPFTRTTNWETEKNDSKDTANAISVNTKYTGILWKANDQDWYKVTVTNPTRMKVVFAPGNCEYGSMKDGWKFCVYDAQLKELAAAADIKAECNTCVLPMKAGTYYIKVVADLENTSWAPIDCQYNLKVMADASGYWEAEYNETSSTANAVNVNTTYKGNLYTCNDVDWYKFTTNAQGYFQVNFSLDDSVNIDGIHDGWKMEVYDANYKKIEELGNIKNNVSSIVLPYKKGTYYVKVEACLKNDSWAPVGCIYGLNITQKSSTAWEIEENDTSQKATAIKLNTQYKGVTATANDADWYKITTSKPGRLSVKLSRDGSAGVEEVGDGWSFVVYSSNASTVVAEAKNIKGSDKASVDVKKGTYYIKVVSTYQNSSWAPDRCRYNIKASYCAAPGKVKISSVKGGAKKETIKWKKVNDATGYYVYRSTSKNGKYKKIATIKNVKTLSYVDKKVGAKKAYYYKVAAYKTANGVTATGTASAVKGAKTK